MFNQLESVYFRDAPTYPRRHDEDTIGICVLHFLTNLGRVVPRLKAGAEVALAAAVATSADGVLRAALQIEPRAGTAQGVQGLA